MSSCSSRTAARPAVHGRWHREPLLRPRPGPRRRLPRRHHARCAPPGGRAAGLALQGTWMLQMGFSFFTDAIAGGCALHAQSRADYTIKCRTHEDYHRARSVATLQFNGHLALLVLAGAATYAAVVSRGNGSPPSGYRMLSKEVQMEGMPLSSQFTLDSDEEKEGEEIATAEPPVANGGALPSPDLRADT